MATAIVTVLLGGFRFWRQQNAMVRGKIFTASWETLVVGILGLLVRRDNGPRCGGKS